jgi:hypothetical protein
VNVLELISNAPVSAHAKDAKIKRLALERMVHP